MAGTLNKVMLIGHTGDDVKMHFFEGGGCVGNFPLATNEDYVNKTTGERVSNTEWHNIVVRNKGAEICEKYLKKGDKVYIEGRIRSRKWQDDKGLDRYITEIQCQEFTFLSPKGQAGETQNEGSKPAAAQESSQNYRSEKSQAPTPQENPSGDNAEEDDLPF